MLVFDLLCGKNAGKAGGKFDGFKSRIDREDCLRCCQCGMSAKCYLLEMNVYIGFQ